MAVNIDAVYFAQTHVMKPTDPYFRLVGERETLIKVHVTDPSTPASPVVNAAVHLDGATLNLSLSGPATLPASIPDGPGVVQHSLDDSFTAVIPADWVKPGMTVDLTAGAVSENVSGIAVGAPTKLKLTMFDVQYFADTDDDYPSGWAEELEVKLPIKELDLRRVPHVVFPELVIPPWRDGPAPAVRISSTADYKDQTGMNIHFESKLNAAREWNLALSAAAGRHGRVSVYYTNIYGTNSNGGKSFPLAGIGNGTEHGVMFHELGHTLGLPHWGNSSSYPYKGAMHGIDPPTINKEVHAGPTWGFDMRSMTFIPCTVQAGNVGGQPTGTYKIDPMHGGGTGYQEPAFLFNHFSDYSSAEMMEFLEANYASWNESLGQFATWDPATSDYTDPLATPDGVNYPIERDVEVISLLASVSGPTPEACMVYPPIGPYTAGLIKRFDPTVEADRLEAQEIYSPSAGCDASLRVTQGGVVRTYLLRAEWLPFISPSSAAGLKTAAINLPASDGEVTRVELLLTPDADSQGLPDEPQVLHTWALNPTPFDRWADGSFPGTLTDKNPTNDADSGGLATELEWVLMGNPTDPADDLLIEPQLDMTSDPDGKLVFQFRRNDLAHLDQMTSIRVQYGSDLAGWTDAVHQGVGPSDITITEADDAYGEGVDMVKVAIPQSLAPEGALFARLVVDISSP
ncbi:M66 family metalloprotease [Coraliomargarita sinensis]|nr:M66 family metalloprotease [Coraliomargarita sinensis]